MNTSDLRAELLGRSKQLFFALHNGLAFVGLLAVLTMSVYLIRPSEAAGEGKSTVFGTIRYDAGSSFDTSPTDVEEVKQRALATYLSRRYKVALDAMEHLVGAAFDVGRRFGLDPLLILAVAGVESGYNPIAESVMGAKGLMQVMPQYHQDKLDLHGGREAVLDPLTNLQVGAQILKEYIRRTGSLETGLQTYAGALTDPSVQYTRKVMAEKEKLRQVVQRIERPTAPPIPARGSEA